MRDAILELLRDGKSYDDICESVGCAKSTVSYYAKRNGLTRQYQSTKNRTHFEWEAVQVYHNEGHSATECQAKFGFSRAAWFKAVTYGRISTDGLRKMIPLSVLLTDNRKSTSRNHLKLRLRYAGLLEDKCAICGISEWLDQPLSLHLDHINGNKHDNRLENLRLLCPNCHSQTATYGGRNRIHSVLR